MSEYYLEITSLHYNLHRSYFYSNIDLKSVLRFPFNVVRHGGYAHFSLSVLYEFVLPGNYEHLSVLNQSDFHI